MKEISIATRRSRLLVLIICSSSLFMNYLDGTVLNVALPAIERDFHASVSSLQWVIDGFLMVLTSLLLLAGSIADRFGRRRLFHLGLGLFCAASVLCSVSASVDELIAFRMLQALGGCFLVPATLSIVRNTFTDAHERAHALGIWSGVFGIAAAAGPIIGGVFVDAFGWRSIFWLNVPIGAIAYLASRRYVPESRAERARRFDPVGQILAIAMLACLTYALIEAPASGWTSISTAALFASAASLCVGFIIYERRRQDPLLETSFFRQRSFSAAAATAVLVYCAFSGFLFINTLYLQQVRGLSALVAGLAILPTMLVITASGPVAGRVLAARGPRALLVVSGIATAAGMALLLSLDPATSMWLLFASYVLIGIGVGLVNTPITNTAVASMPASQAGVASAVASSSRQLGSVLGVAIMGSLASTGLAENLTMASSARRISLAQVHAVLSRGTSAIGSTQGSAHHLVVAAFSSAMRACFVVGIISALTWTVLGRLFAPGPSSSRDVPLSTSGDEPIEAVLAEAGL